MHCRFIGQAFKGKRSLTIRQKCLGGVVDLQINACSGAIEALIVPGPGKFCGFFGTDSEYVIPFACIKKIGPDIILVEIKEEKFLQKY